MQVDGKKNAKLNKILTHYARQTLRFASLRRRRLLCSFGRNNFQGAKIRFLLHQETVRPILITGLI